MAETKPFLVEIGTEELPPKSLRTLAQAFGAHLRAKLGALGLVTGQQEQIYWSPRRLAVLLPAVRIRQVDGELESFGPPTTIAFDVDGKPTPAAEGFARKCDTTVAKLGQKNGKLYFKKKAKGRPAKELIVEAVNESLGKLPVPRRMRWGTGNIEFVRPVHWVVLLLGDHIVKAEILGIKAGNKTYGHRFHHPAAITLKRPSDYRKLLEKTGKVLVDDRDCHGELEEGALTRKIRSLVNRTAKRIHGKAQLDPSLLKEVAALVEWPVPVLGSFDKKFLALPDEVIVAVLETQQRYFPLRDAKGKLLPYFIAISNIQSRKPAVVRSGNERVITPRLTDAEFFWNSDLKHTLESRIPELDRIVFQKELGSYGDKSRRVSKLVVDIARTIYGDPQQAERAALLAKCDFVTGMVGEFPELQGIMGGYYARHDGESEEVCSAITEQYLPRFAGDAVPKTKTGQALAIADKLDTVCGLFIKGQKPTGEKDPFALRRQALGVLRIAIECKLDLDFKVLIREALEQFQSQHEFIKLELWGFFSERLRAYYEELGIDVNVYYAVEASEDGNPYNFDVRLKQLKKFLKTPEAKNLISANKRIANILKKEGVDIMQAGTINIDLLKENSEHVLNNELIEHENKIRPLIKQRDYFTALVQLSSLRPKIDDFFDEVTVNANDLALKKNRIALLATLRRLFLQICDLSLIQLG